MGKRKTIALFVLSIMLIGIAALLLGCSQQKKPALKFSTGECSQELDPYLPPGAGLLMTDWLDNSTLLIEGFVKTYCGGAEIKGDYLLEGNNLTLEYEVETDEAVTSCICAHKAIYEISNLGKEEYSISIRQES